MVRSRFTTEETEHEYIPIEDPSGTPRRFPSILSKVILGSAFTIAFLSIIKTTTFSQQSSNQLDEHLEILKESSPKTGYLESRSGANLFYWLFESRGDPYYDPLTIWLQGGPGSTSELAMMCENGPVKFEENKLVRNPYSWTEVSNMMYIDQPAGTGFSFGKSDGSFCKTSDCAAQNLLEALEKFFVMYPKFAGRALYIAGESYGGHWVPVIAYHIMTYNQNQGAKINLKGIMVGNGVLNAPIQHGTYLEFMQYKGLVHENDIGKYKALQEKCNLEQRNIGLDGEYCTQLISELLQGRNFYDIRRMGDYDFSMVNNLMSSKKMSQFLNTDHKWSFDADQVGTDFKPDDFVTTDIHVASILDYSGIKVLIYAGKDDFCLNIIGQRKWLNQMLWHGQKRTQSTRMEPWFVDGNIKGSEKKIGNLRYVEIDEAGHMVPEDQPKAALHLLKTLIES